MKLPHTAATCGATASTSLHEVDGGHDRAPVCFSGIV
jgi:hypothetical protein